MRAVSSTALVITVAYVIAVVIGSVISFAIWASTRNADGEADTHTWGHRERAWLVVVLAGLFGLLLATIFYIPYGDDAGPNRQLVRVVGVQYAWAIQPAEVLAGRPVEFRLETRESSGQPAVNHGFGVYDPDGALLTQAQVVPDRTQPLVWTFDEPGTYTVRCLEYCGAGHHEMNAEFEVLER
jgi:cytochrome c oxidase subunit 2